MVVVEAVAVEVMVTAFVVVVVTELLAVGIDRNEEQKDVAWLALLIAVRTPSIALHTS